jgi:hypothetical protein
MNVPPGMPRATVFLAVTLVPSVALAEGSQAYFASAICIPAGLALGVVILALRALIRRSSIAWLVAVLCALPAIVVNIGLLTPLLDLLHGKPEDDAEFWAEICTPMAAFTVGSLLWLVAKAARLTGLAHPVELEEKTPES